MRQVDLVFVVCTYGSHEDLLNFIDSVNELNVKSAIVVANSFCSEETRDVIKKHAEERGCDFLDLPNKGYGHSLNEGIEYARKNYEFKYLAITNADILVKKFDLNIEDKACVFAPEVITKTGKKQNPFYIFQYRKTFLFARWAKDHFLKIFKYSVMVKAKIHRVLFNLFYVKGTYRKIYAAHGCFIVFNEKALDLLGRPFEDDIFLYCEENFLGHKLKRMGIPLYYTSRVSVRHMEDGSSAFYKQKINAEMEKSVAKYYDLLEKTKK